MGILDAPLVKNQKLRDEVDSGASIALQPFYAGLGNRDNAPCVIVHVGDSLTEGANATSRDKRWVSRMRDGLRNRFPTSGIGTGGGFGFLAPYFIGTTMGTAHTSLIGTVPGTDNTFGWGRRSAKLSATNLGYNYTVYGTAIDICHVQATAATSIKYTIDGGAEQTISIASGLADGKRTRVSLGASGSHTVQIKWGSGTDAYFTGLMVYDGDESKGIHVIEGGHWGWKTTDWVSGGTYWPQNFTPQQAHLVSIGLMVNDYQANVAPATAKANIQAMITAIRAVHTIKPSFVLPVWHQRGDVASPTYPWSQYVQAAYEIAAEDTGGIGGRSGVTVFDLSRRLPTPGAAGAGDPLGLIHTDRVHVLDKGHFLVGDAWTGFLSPR